MKWKKQLITKRFCEDKISKNTKEVEKKVVGDVKSFVVDRSTWYRGKGADKRRPHHDRDL